MTATADEDHGLVLVCADRRRLIEAALRLGAELNTGSTVERDRKGREYVEICVITRDSGESDEAFGKENNRALGRFFEIFDGMPKLSDRPIVERRNLYDELSLGDHGEDVRSIFPGSTSKRSRNASRTRNTRTPTSNRSRLRSERGSTS